MKISYILFVMVVMLAACDFPTSTSDELHSDLNPAGAETWEQVGVRDVSTGIIADVIPNNIVTLKIDGDNLLFGLHGDYCGGKLNDGSIDLSDDCYTQSPHWIISERNEDTMYIYPRLGAMYHHDFVMKKIQDN